MKKIYLLILSLSIAVSGWSQLLTENFSYTAGSALTTNGNWLVHSGTTNPILVTAAGLTYTGHPGSGVGNAVAMTTSGEDDNSLFATPVTTGSTYMSFLVNVSAAQAAGDYFIGLFQSSSVFPLRIYAKSSGAGYVFGIGKSGGTVVYESTVRTFGTTYFVVGNYIYNSGTTTDDVINLWINPALGGTEPAADIPGVTGTTADGTSNAGVYLRQGSATAAPTQQVDAILAGTTWAQVTPSATSATLSATALTAFGNVCLNTASAANSFTITGANLTAGNITVAALAGYTYSTTSGGAYTATLTLPETGTLSQQVFVKLTPTAVQSYSGNIAISGGGATAINVAATGAGVNTIPTVTTAAATGVTTSTATVPGTITANGCSAVTAYGIEYSTTAGFVNGTGTAVPSTNQVAGAYTSALSGLASGTIYYYHAYATNGGGTAYSSELNFTTGALTPTLSATALTAFGPVCVNTTAGPNSFTLSGSSLTAGNITIAALAGYTYSTTAGGTYTPTLTIAETGTLSQQVFVNFTPTAVQSYNGNIAISGGGATAINVAASGSGINTLPTVTTAAATAVTGTSATVPGTITANGCSAVTVYGIEYSTSIGFANGTGTPVPSTNQVAGAYTSSLSGLAQSTTYYYHAYATNGGGTAYSSELNFTTSITSTVTSGLVISQIYGSGGNTGATYNADYVEIKNITAAPINLGGLSIQYGSATVTTAWSGVFALPVATIPAGGYYLIQMTAAGGIGIALPTPDATATTSINMSGTAGRVAIVNGTTALVGCPAAGSYIDLVGFGTTATCFEGTGPAAAQSATLADFRKLNGCQDTNDNTADFDALAAAPRNSATAPVSCSASPSLSATALTAFGPVCLNTTAGPNSFTITGTNLTAGTVTVAALAGYTYSTTAAGTYTATLPITNAAGAFSQQVFVKFTPTAVQSYSGNISISGGGVVTPITVAASGSGVNTVPTVTTAAATAITSTTATVPGTITANGCSAVTVYGIEYSTTAGFVNGTGTAVPSTNQVAGAYTSALSGLAPGTIYYYHAYATNAGGTGYSSELNFTTLTPSLSATALTAFGPVCLNTTAGPNSFTITGTNLTAGTVTVAALAGYTYSTTAAGTYTATLSITNAAGAFSQQVFVKFTPTAVQSYNGNIAISGGGVVTPINVAASGSGVNTVPTLTTAAATGVTTTTATVPGTITANGCSAVTAYGIEYSTTAGFANGTGTAVPSTNQVAGAYTSALSGLAPGTIYYYHAYATNAGGTGYSSELNFTTTALTPTLTATALTAFGNVCINTTAGPNSFTITGSALTAGNITVAALAGYTYSTTAAGTYTATLTIAETGTISQQVFVKFTPTAVQSYSGNIAISGGGATTINVAASGSGVNTIATVVSGAASAITSSTATVAGNISANGCSAVTAYGIEYSTTAGFANGTGTAVSSTNQVAGAYTSALSGLTASTVYYYHAYATNGGGTAYGAELNFTTLTPSLSATALTAFGPVCLNTTAGPNSFTITGSGLTTGNITVAALAGYTYSTTAGGTYTTTLTIPETGAVSQQVFVKFTPTAVQSYSGNIAISGGGATAINVAASGSGINTLATVTSGVASAITSSSATVAGNISANGCSAVSAYGIEYSTTIGFANGTGTAVPSTNQVAGAYTSALSGLAATTVYYYHAYATNGGGTAYGSELNFTTTGAATMSATALTAFGPVCLNTTAGPNSFTITGSGLTAGNITVAALAGYTYSTTSGGTYTATLTIAEIGTVSQQVFVKFTPTAVQSYNGNIAISGGGATAINVAASGSGVNTIATVTTAAASAITTSSATVPGTITTNGCSAVTVYGIEYSTTPGFANGTGTAVPSTNQVAGAYTSALSGLAAATNYYYHAYATNGGGTAYSSELFFTTGTSSTVSSGLVISQLYGSGGNTGATYSADYVELKNITTSPISTSGLSIQYGSAAVTTAWSGVFALPTATIAPGAYYLIQMSAAGTTGIAIPTPDATATAPINMSGTAGRVALVNGTTALVGCPAAGTYIDLVGYGTTATCFEGSTGPAPAPGAALADFRKLNGCQDTNDNSVDFDALLPAPRNSATAAISCGSSTTPSLSATALTAFGPVCLNTTAGPNSFTITGTNLTAGTVTVAALSGYTYSTTAGGTYTATLAITNAAGAFSQQVFVKFTPTAVQSYNGNIAISGGGVTTPINVSASGSGVNTIATVVSGAASAVTANSATVAGSITANGCSAITAYGVEYSTTNGFANGTGTAVPSTNIAAGAFTSALSGLASSTVYYYHAYATNSGGTAYGAQGTFTTTVPTTPTLSSTAPAAFGNTCVNTTAGPNNFTISGSLLTNANITVGPLAGFTFSTTAGGVYTASLILTQAGGTYSQQVFIKFTPTAIQSYSGNIPVSGGGATAINVSASGAGVNSAPTVTSGAASAITQTTATVAGSIPSNGCSAVTAYGIEYSTVSGFANGTGTAVPSTNLTGGAFSSNLTGLTVGTTYYYHAYATNGGGTGYGNQLSFTTTAAVLTASALTAFGPVCTNTTAGPNSFTITSGAVSAANINVAALAGYTYSTTAAGTYTATLSITHAAGALAQTVFVKFTPTAVQSYNGNIVISGGGAAGNTNVAASGSGINTGATVVTGAATNVLQHSATLAGTISSAGCNAPTSYGIEYSSIIGFANGTGLKVPSTNINTTTGGYTIDLNGLVQNTTYYYKAYAISASGTAYGTQQSFTTARLTAGLIIYSNPIVRGGQLAFSVDSLPPAHYVVTILNNIGQEVFTQGVILQLNFLDTRITVPSFLPAGTYVLRLRNTNGTFKASRRFLLL